MSVTITTTDTTNAAVQINGVNKLVIGGAAQIGIGGANYGTAGQVLTSGGPSAAPTWSTVSGGGGSYVPIMTSGYFPVGSMCVGYTVAYINPGATASGASITYPGGSYGIQGFTLYTGTWRNIGSSISKDETSGGGNIYQTLWQRIA